MREFSVALLLTSTGQKKVSVAENKYGLLANPPNVNTFFKTDVFNESLQSCHCVILKRLRWVMQF